MIELVERLKFKSSDPKVSIVLDLIGYWYPKYFILLGLNSRDVNDSLSEHCIKIY